MSSQPGKSSYECELISSSPLHFKSNETKLTDASVRLLLPPRLKENEITKYPLLVHVYGGPGSQQVSERFFISWGHRLAASMNIIYALIDGRGSGYKGDKILHEIYHRFGTVEVDDQTQVTRSVDYRAAPSYLTSFYASESAGICRITFLSSTGRTQEFGAGVTVDM